MNNQLVTYQDVVNYLNDDSESYEDELQDVKDRCTEALGDLVTNLMEKNTPDSFNATPNSSTWKFWQGALAPLYMVIQSIQSLNIAHYVKFASNSLLDMWGKQYDVQRNGLVDDDYRIRIMMKIMSTHSAGTKNDILNIINQILPNGGNSAYTKLSTKSSDTIVIGGIPSNSLTSKDMFDILTKELEDVVADGIAIETVQFEDDTSLLIKYGVLGSNVVEFSNICK